MKKKIKPHLLLSLISLKRAKISFEIASQENAYENNSSNNKNSNYLINLATKNIKIHFASGIIIDNF